MTDRRHHTGGRPGRAVPERRGRRADRSDRWLDLETEAEAATTLTAPRPRRSHRAERLADVEARPARPWGRLLMSVGAVCLLAAATAMYGVYHEVSRVTGNLKRVNGVLSDSGGRNGTEPGGQPPAPDAVDTMNFLIVGSDARTSVAGSDQRVNNQSDSSRTDTIMLMHLNKANTKGYLISLPRDAYVPIPGHGRNKINAAFAYGGPKLLISTVQNLTGVHIDHYIEIDFAGFKQLTDLVGGVDVVVDKAVCDERYCWTPGTHHLTGEQALAYARQRHELAGGDYDRQRRQQQFLHSLMVKLQSQGVTSDWTKAQQLVEAVSKMLTVDGNLNPLSMAWSLRHLNPSDVDFLGLQPLDSSEQVAGAGVVEILGPATHGLWQAVQDDSLDPWLAANPAARNDPTHGR